MNFTNTTMRPGRVLEVYEGGKIKASVPGLFNKNDLDGLPLISPFTIGGSPNSFSTPSIHDEIWVMNDNSNPEILYWFRKDKTDRKNFEEAGITQNENTEIVCNKETDTGWATIAYQGDTGWTINDNDTSLNINKDGNIVLTNGDMHRDISISNDCISLGTAGRSEHPAAYGDEIEKALNIISRAFKLIRSMTETNAMLIPISISLQKLPEELDEAIKNISSCHVYLD